MNSDTIVDDTLINRNKTHQPSKEVYVSNCMQTLVDKLQERISQHPPTVERILVILPSHGIKSFIFQYFLCNKKGPSSLFGVRFVTLPQAIQLFAKATQKKPFHFPQSKSLALHIEALLPSEEKNKILYAEQLAQSFLHYGLYGGKARKHWEQKNGTQQQLWHALKTFWDFPYRVVNEHKSPHVDYRIHMFCPTYIPPLYLEYFQKLQQYWDIDWYLLSPSPHYWGDVLSDKALSYLSKTFLDKGINTKEIGQFTSICKEVPSLLRNLSKALCPLHHHFLEERVHEYYIQKERTSLLSHIQADIYEFTTAKTIELDDSICIQHAPSKLQEVQATYHKISHLLTTTEATPKDILLLAPDITEYAPYLSFVFSRPQAPFGLHITQSPTSAHHVFTLLFSLHETNFSIDNIVSFLQHPAVCQKHGLTEEDIRLFKTLYAAYGFHWGYDQTTRSFCKATDRLLEDLPLTSSPIPFSSIESLNTCIQIVKDIHAHVCDLYQTERTLSDWVDVLQTTASLFIEDISPLTNALKSLSTLPKEIDHLYSFDSIRPQFIETAPSVLQSHNEAIVCDSLQDGCMRPCRHLFLLGLSFDAFPRTRNTNSINELRHHPQVDPQPHTGDKDRALLLQALLVTKDSITLSYSQPDPSTLITDIITYVETTYNVTPKTTHHTQHTIHSIKKAASLTEETTHPTLQSHYDISLADLSRLGKNPLQLFSQKTLQLYFTSDNPMKEREESEFFLSYLQRGLLKYQYVRNQKPYTPLFPTSLFSCIAHEELESHIAQIDQSFNAWSLTPKDLFQIHLHPACIEPYWAHSTKLVVPSITLTCDNTEITLHGQYHNLSRKGLCCLGKGTTANLCRYLPLYTIFAHYFTEEMEPYLLFTEGETFHLPITEEDVHNLLAYLLDALKYPSPLRCEWMTQLIKDEWGCVQQSTKDPYNALLSLEHQSVWADHLQKYFVKLLEKAKK